MSTIEVKIKNIDQIRAAFLKAPAEMTKNLDVAIRKSIMTLRADSVKNAPVDLANLRGSVYSIFSVLKGEIGFKAKYAAAVHDGTKPHPVSWEGIQALEDWAKRKGMSPAAGYAIAWKIRMKGSKANPFLKKAVDDDAGQLDAYFKAAVQDALNSIARDAG